MSIDDLRADYRSVTGTDPIIEFVDYLDENCPAEVWENDEIRLWDKLASTDLVEAEAHELVHIILRYRGLVAFTVNFDTAFAGLGYPQAGDFQELHNQLCREINGAISHRYLISTLKEAYGIESILHTRARCGNFNYDHSHIPVNNKLVQHMDGLRAYDIFISGLKDITEVKKLITDKEATEAFEASIQFLSPIHPRLGIPEQIALSKNLYEALGYEFSYFKILEPFPLISAGQKMSN